jgi:hypothetical protein
MSRVPTAFRESTIKKRQVGAIWRGIGLILLVGLTVGAFWLAGYVLDRNLLGPYLPIAIPQNFTVTLATWLPPLPGKLLVQIGAALLIDVFAYSLLVVLYAIFNPIRRGPNDADQPRGGRRRRSLVR